MNIREQMNIVIVGHVDHGKSTVIGRLLADTGSLPMGKLESIKEYCAKNSKPFEYAFLLDALKDEQAQGITIDTSRCFFKTKKRDYIIIDAPGHIEFLKNMVTGASRAEAALLVIDAKEGIRENSKRHGHLASMLGIRQVAVLVNKMDLVNFEKERFESIRDEFAQFLNKVNIKPLKFIPISAFRGDNIAVRSCNTNWYDGPTVLEQLDKFINKKQQQELPFRMPVQDVYKFTKQGDSRRIAAGTVISGAVSIGDEVIFLPSRKKSIISSIEGFNVAPRDTAYSNEAIGVTLKTEIYIKPGELMVKINESHPIVSSRFRVNIFWVGRVPMVKNKKYKLKLGTMRMGVKLVEILSIIDMSEMNVDTQKDQIERHDVAECILETVKPIAFDLISEIEQTGRFVIVDSYEISGGGIVLESVPEHHAALSQSIGNRDVFWEKGLVSAQDRKASYGHDAAFIVITSGGEGNEQVIRDIGKELEKRLFQMKYKAYYLDFLSVVQGLGLGNLSENERDDSIRHLGEVAKIFTDSGQILICPVFNLDDYEAKKLTLINRANKLLIINIGESSLSSFKPDANINADGAVDVIYHMLINILQYNNGIVAGIPI